MKRSSIVVTICVLTLAAMASGQEGHQWVGMDFLNPNNWYSPDNWVPPAWNVPSHHHYDIFCGNPTAYALVLVDSGGGINVMGGSVSFHSGFQVQDGRMGVAGNSREFRAGSVRLLP